MAHSFLGLPAKRVCLQRRPWLAASLIRGNGLELCVLIIARDVHVLAGAAPGEHPCDPSSRPLPSPSPAPMLFESVIPRTDNPRYRGTGSHCCLFLPQDPGNGPNGHAQERLAAAHGGERAVCGPTGAARQGWHRVQKSNVQREPTVSHYPHKAETELRTHSQTGLSLPKETQKVLQRWERKS